LQKYNNIFNPTIKKIIKNKSIFIFDFDGVLVDSVNVKTNAFVALYKKYGNNVVNQVIKHHILNGGISRYEKFKYYHRFFLNQKISNEEIKMLDKEFSNYVVNEVVHAPEIEGVTNFLNRIYKKCRIYINSGTPTIELKKIIDLRGWSHYFTQVLGSPDDKIANTQTILDYEKKQSIKDCLFFGDAETDYKAANYFGIDFILLKTSEISLPFTKTIQHKISNFNRL